MRRSDATLSSDGPVARAATLMRGFESRVGRIEGFLPGTRVPCRQKKPGHVRVRVHLPGDHCHSSVTGLSNSAGRSVTIFRARPQSGDCAQQRRPLSRRMGGGLEPCLSAEEGLRHLPGRTHTAARGSDEPLLTPGLAFFRQTRTLLYREVFRTACHADLRIRMRPMRGPVRTPAETVGSRSEGVSEVRGRAGEAPSRLRPPSVSPAAAGTRPTSRKTATASAISRPRTMRPKPTRKPMRRPMRKAMRKARPATPRRSRTRPSPSRRARMPSRPRRRRSPWEAPAPETRFFAVRSWASSRLTAR